MLPASGGEFWSPQRVQHYHDYLQHGLPNGEFMTFRRAYIKNISYAFQYLEYIDYSLTLPLHSVVENQLQKTFIITGCSAIESILWILLKGNGLQKQDEWKQIQSRQTNAYEDGASKFKFEVNHFQKLTLPVDVQMRFIDMCRLAEKKKVLNISSDVYAKIGHLRSLRNRVHIHSVQHDRDNDWWTFESRDIETMKEVLRDVLHAGNFAPFPNYNPLFDWLQRQVQIGNDVAIE